MKWSKYNKLFISKDNIPLLYNSVSNSFAELNIDTYAKLIKLKENEIDFDQFDEELKNTLIESKIVVKNDLDEYYEIKLNALYKRFSNKILSLTIAPTMDCNFRCSYCYEENKPLGTMDDRTEENLIEFIKKSCEKKLIFITWFGGEPLMAFDKIVSITKKLVDLDFKISSNIVTNGYLLNSEIADLLKENYIQSLQITIDGSEDTHNKRRCLIDGEGTFDVIVRNISYLVVNCPEINIAIRVNIDKNNFKEYTDVYNMFKQKFGDKNIFVYPGYVEDNNACASISNCNFDRISKVDFLKEQFYNNRITQLNFFPNCGYGECMARNVNAYVVDASGYLYKCWNDIGVYEKSIGNINKKGYINNTLLTRYLTSADPFETPKCINCFYLPNCGGGCPYKRINELYDSRKSDYCTIHKGNIEDLLEIHYNIKKNEKN